MERAIRAAVRREIAVPRRDRVRRRVLALVAVVAAVAGAGRARAASTPTWHPVDVPGLRAIAVDSAGRAAFADLDGDGDLDLVLGTYFAGLPFYRNTGTPSAPAFVEAWGSDNPLLAIRADSTAPSFGDLDGDGDLDLAVGNLQGLVQIYENSGSAADPRFVDLGTANPLAALDVLQQASPSLGDVDGDGDLDLVVGNQPGTIEYWENTGTTGAAFAERTAAQFSLGSGAAWSAPALGDLDGDGDLDLVAGYNSGLRTYLQVDGSAPPSFSEQTGIPYGTLQTRPSGPALGDLDADGDLDLAVAVLGGLEYHRNTGGTSAPAFLTVSAASPLSPGPLVANSAPALGDLDGDGDLDLVVGGSSIVFYEGTGSGDFQQTSNFGSLSVDAPNFVPALGDLDADGDLDLLLDVNPGLLYVRNDGTPSAPSWVAVTSGSPLGSFGDTTFWAPAIGDLDGDGLPEIVLASRGETGAPITVLHNTGAPSAPAYVPLDASASPFDGVTVGSGYATGFALGDVDGDGDLDAAVGTFDDGVTHLLRNTGTALPPAFAVEEGVFAGAEVPRGAAPALGDVDRDGGVDLVVGEWRGVVHVAHAVRPPDIFATGFEPAEESFSISSPVLP